MYCPSCGYPAQENDRFCRNCGKVLREEPRNETIYDNGVKTPTEELDAKSDPYRDSETGYTAPPSMNTQPSPPPYYGTYTADPVSSEISTAKTMGIIAIICAVVGFPIVSIVLGAIGISKMNRLLSMDPMLDPAVEAKKLSKIGLIVGIVSLVLAVLIIAACIAVFILATMSGSTVDFAEFSEFPEYVLPGLIF